MGDVPYLAGDTGSDQDQAPPPPPPPQAPPPEPQQPDPNAALAAAMQQLYGPQQTEQPQPQPKSYHHSVIQGIMDALAPQIEYSADASGKITANQVPNTGGSFAKKVIAGALEGFARAGATQPGPGYTARAAAAGTGGGLQLAKNLDEEGRKRALQDYTMQENAKLRKAQMVMTAQNFATQQLQFLRQGIGLEQDKAHMNAWADEQIKANNMRDLGVFTSFNDPNDPNSLVKKAAMDPQIHDAIADGRIFQQPNYEDGKRTGIRAAIRPPGQRLLDADLKIPIMGPPDANGKPTADFQTIQKGSPAAEAYDHSNAAWMQYFNASNAYEKQQTEKKEADIRLKEQERQDRVATAQIRASNAEADLREAQKTQLTGGFDPAITAAALQEQPKNGVRENFLSSLPPGLQATVKAVGEGRMALPPMRGTTQNQQNSQIINAVNLAYPGYKQEMYKSYQDALVELGPKGRTGQGLVAASAGLVHMREMYDAANWLATGPASGLAREFGYKPANTLEMSRQRAINAIHGAYDHGVIGKEERDTWEKQLNVWSPWEIHEKIEAMMQELSDKIKAQEFNFRSSVPPGAELPGGQLISPDAVDSYRHVMQKDPDLTIRGVQPGQQQPGMGTSRFGVSLKEAMAAPMNKGKSEDQVRQDIIANGHTVLP